MTVDRKIIFVAIYPKNLASILLEYGSKFTENDIELRFVIRMKTRMALRRLDPARRTILIRILYDLPTSHLR